MRRILMTLVLAPLASWLISGTAHAQYVVYPTTREIREDWKLVVAQGDTANNGPQIMTYMSPVSDTSDAYAWFLINVRDNPNPFTPGGLMVQIWDYSDKLVASSTSTQATAQLNTANETITWTQRLYYNSAKSTLTQEILGGASTTWGTFGSSNSLAPITYTTGIANLSGYDPHVSASKSRVGWQANNVTSLTLVQVRQYNSKGSLVSTDNVNLTVNLAPQ